ncbi:PREDICTED: putative BTB/POZ domain-containing protein At2g40450 [Tarenaya hassleriana]|uniref:putative BTB/POZ domain-containing protein At2g40450 n=1 Tax=Tarenaya hassleriana TaxID=28532 RepID=UPI00053C4B43|nr:PREDICTED: putative BTB/POZ domain-containing protein At2g40450 [Tarenaya hassleriana]
MASETDFDVFCGPLFKARQELEAFIEYLCGSLPDDKLKLHVRFLYLSSYKYDIPYLQDVCRTHLISNLNSSNALDVLELSGVFSDGSLRRTSMDFAVGHAREIAFSAEFKEFVERSPGLAVDIMQASFK